MFKIWSSQQAKHLMLVIFTGSHVSPTLKSGNTKRGVHGSTEGFKGMGSDLAVSIERFCNEPASADIMHKHILG